MAEPPTEPTIAPTGVSPPRPSKRFFALYQHSAEKLCTVPFGPGKTSFHIGTATHDGSALGAFGEPQFDPFHGRSVGRGNGICSVSSLILSVYRPAAFDSAVPFDAAKPPAS